jgi:hypothetical protein
MPEEEENVSIRVFMSEELRTEFKVACARNKISMSQQVVKLVQEWVTQQQK